MRNTYLSILIKLTQIVVILIFMLTMNLSAEKYDTTFQDGEWTNCWDDTDFSGVGIARSDCDSDSGKMKIFTFVLGNQFTNNDTAIAKAYTFKRFKYEHHTYPNTLEFGYDIRGIVEYLGADVTFTVRAELYDSIGGGKQELELLHKEIQIYEANSGMDTGDDSSQYIISFNSVLEENHTYEAHLYTEALCKAYEAGQQGSVEFYDTLGVEDYFVDLKYIRIHHTHDSTNTYNDGDSTGTLAREEYHIYQKSFDWADSIRFSISNSDDDCYMDTWYVTVTDFDTSSSHRADDDNARARVKAWASDQWHQIKYNYCIRVEVAQWISEHCACPNTMKLYGVHWTEGSDPGQRQLGQIIPDHHWRIFPPINNGDGTYSHVFVMTNSTTNPADTLRIEGLAFDTTSENVEYLDTSTFTPPISRFILAQGEIWEDTIITEGEYLGGYINFKYSLYGINGNNPASNVWGSHEVSDIYLCGDANGDLTVDISDAVYLINFAFGGGPAPDPLRSADANCDGATDISDAVFIITYAFGGGNPPCDTNYDHIPDC